MKLFAAAMLSVLQRKPPWLVFTELLVFGWNAEDGVVFLAVDRKAFVMGAFLR